MSVVGLSLNYIKNDARLMMKNIFSCQIMNQLHFQTFLMWQQPTRWARRGTKEEEKIFSIFLTRNYLINNKPFSIATIIRMKRDVFEMLCVPRKVLIYSTSTTTLPHQCQRYTHTHTLISVIWSCRSWFKALSFISETRSSKGIITTAKRRKRNVHHSMYDTKAFTKCLLMTKDKTTFFFCGVWIKI